jgi:hypothetical protein
MHVFSSSKCIRTSKGVVSSSDNSKYIRTSKGVVGV